MDSEDRVLSQSELEQRSDFYIKLNFKDPLRSIWGETGNVLGFAVGRES